MPNRACSALTRRCRIAQSAAVARAPSGSIPMSSGRRRMMTIMGRATNRLKYPISRKAIRQSATSVIRENAWTISAPLMGR